MKCDLSVFFLSKAIQIQETKISPSMQSYDDQTFASLYFAAKIYMRSLLAVYDQQLTTLLQIYTSNLKPE